MCHVKDLRNSSILDPCIGIASRVTEGYASLPIVENGVHIVGTVEGAIAWYITGMAQDVNTRMERC